MKEVISVHLQGKMFQMEKDAYQVLMAALKNQWQQETLEGKLAEWFTAKNKPVITLPDVEEACQAFQIPYSQPGGAFLDQYTGEKKLRRPAKGKTIGGVCAAIANYFNTDVVLIRVLFVLGLFLLLGTSLLLYLILWIVVPEENAVR